MAGLALSDLFDAKVFAQYYRNLDPTLEVPFIGESLFPMEQHQGLELSWIKGYNQFSAVLQPSAYDAQAPYRDRIGVEKVLTELPFFRERMRIGEKERTQIRQLMANGAEQAMPIIRRIYDDVATLVNGARTQIERMRMELLATSKINIKAGADTGTNVEYVYDFDKDCIHSKLNCQTLDSDKQWTDDNKAKSKPMEDILEFIIYLKRYRNVHPTKLLMNLNTFLQMIHSESIVKAINPLAATNFFLTPANAKNYIETQLGLSIEVYEKMYKDENKNICQFLPDGLVIFLPGHAVGKTNFGITPEAADLNQGALTGANVAVLDNGITVTTVQIPHPVNVEHIVDMVVLPSIERLEETARLTVF